MGQGKYARNRPDKDGTFRAAFDKNKKTIYATQTICAICGKPVDFSLKFPDPMSPTVDHVIPISKGGHPSDLQNLQLAHLSCNRGKADKVINKKYIADKSIATVNGLESVQSIGGSDPYHHAFRNTRPLLRIFLAEIPFFSQVTSKIAAFFMEETR